jgi:glycerol uptake facilitator-like aquaporin
MTLSRRLAAEGVGTALLLAVVVGSGIMGERLAAGNAAIALLANSIATGCGLWVLITMFGPISGAHFNPVVTLAFAATGEFAVARRDAVSMRPTGRRVRGRCGRAFDVRAAAFHRITARTNRPGSMVERGRRHRRPAAHDLAGCAARAQWVGGLVAVYITGAYWFTASTSFANPAVTLARSATDTFAGIRPEDVPWFVVAQLAGATVATVFARWLIRPPARSIPQ